MFRKLDPRQAFGGKRSQRRVTAASAENNGNNNNNNNNNKGVLKYLSADESLKSVYGSERALADDVSGGTTTTSSKQQHSKSGSGNRKSLGRSRSVIFTAIEIREYARTVGDNPSCSSGPPMSISWEYNPEAIRMPLDDYEDRRPERRTVSEMVLPRTVRDHILRKEWDISQQQIASAIRETIRVKHLRRQTVNNLGKDKVEEILENTGRKLMRGLLLKKSTTSAFEKLEQQYKAVEAEKKLLKLKELMKAQQQQQENGVDVSLTDVQDVHESAQPREGGLNGDDECDGGGEEMNMSCSGEDRHQCKGEQTAERGVHDATARSFTNNLTTAPEAAAADSHGDDVNAHAILSVADQANMDPSSTSTLVVAIRDHENSHLDQSIAADTAESETHNSRRGSSKVESAATLQSAVGNHEADTALVAEAVLIPQSNNRSTEGVAVGCTNEEKSPSDQAIVAAVVARSIKSHKSKETNNFNGASLEV